MSHSVQMPALGESVTEGTVTRWLKKEGDQVAEDEPLLEVSTDKVDTEIPAPYAGILEKILVGEDETVEVGAELAIIGSTSPAAVDGAAPAAMTPSAPEAAPGNAAGAAEPEAAEPGVGEAADMTPPPPTPAPEPVAAPEPAAAPAPTPPAEPAATDASAAPASDQPGTEVVMPAMGESVTEGTITRWLKAVGDEIAEDEPIVEIATDKVDAEVPSPVAGTLLRILAEEDATVEVGSPLAMIGSGQPRTEAGPTPAVPDTAAVPAPEEAPAPAVATALPEPGTEAAAPPAEPPTAATAAPAAPPAPPTPAASPAAAPTAVSARGGYVTPVVRKLAADHGVDLSTITGTGVGGRIRREDVLAAARRAAEPAAATAPVAAAPAPAPDTTAAPAQAAVAAPAPVPVPGRPSPQMRQAMARSMMHAATTAAQTTTIMEIDASRVVALKDRAQAAFTTREGTELTALPFFVKAAIEAAKTNPVINSSLSEDLASIVHHPTVNLGITIDTERGQIAPVIHRADELNVTGLARRIADLAIRIQGGAIMPGELTGATLTVSSSAATGTVIETPIVVPPQAAILAFGAIVKRPVVVSDLEGNDVIAVRSMVTVALSYDQRFVDAGDAGRYLAAVKHRIEDGDFNADLGV